MLLDIRHARLPSGFIIIDGAQGVGKTSLAAAMLCTDYKHHNAERQALAQELAASYGRANHVPLRLADHQYFSGTRIVLDTRYGVETHYIDISKLALPNADFPVQYIPRGSVIFIPEADTQLFNRDYKDTNDYLRSLLKYVRHNLLTIIFDVQSNTALDKAVRRLATQIYRVGSSGLKRFLWFRPRHRWDFLVVDNQLNETVKDFAEIGVHLKLDVVRKAHFHYKGDIFSRYDSFSGVPYFLTNLKEYSYTRHPRSSYRQPDIAEYCRLHPLTKPKETKKTAKGE